MDIFTFTKRYSPKGFHPIKKIKFFFSDISCAIQRARKGYCYRDLWNIDSWLFELLPNMIKEFKQTTSGYPSSYNSMEEWQAELDYFISLLEQYNQIDYPLKKVDNSYDLIMDWLKNNLTNLWD